MNIVHIKLSDFDPSEEPYSLVDQDVFNLVNECLEANESGKVQTFSAEESIERMEVVTREAVNFAIASKKRTFTAER